MKVSKREIIGVILVILIIFAGAQFSFQSFRVQGVSMEPSFHNKQYLLIDKLKYRFGSPGRGDVVVFRNPQYAGELYIKRVVGLPGEKVEIKKGNLYINGIELNEDPDFASIPNLDDYSVTVPADQYFVLGDNRGNSSGSHIFGPVPEENIVGRVWLCYWPPSEWGLSPRYSVDLEEIITVSIGSL